MDEPGHTKQVRRARRLEYLAAAYNGLAGLIAVDAGLHAGSHALVGFGLYCLVEVAVGAALLWRLHVDPDKTRRGRAEAIALRVSGVCLLTLALYLGDEALTGLLHYGQYGPAPRSVTGVVLASVSLVTTLLLTRAKKRAAAGVRSAAMVMDARQSRLANYLPAVLLGGLLLGVSFGWRWADPAAALAMVPILVLEGVESLRRET